MRTVTAIILAFLPFLPLPGQTGPGIPQLEAVTVEPQPGGEEWVYMSWTKITGDGYIIFHYEYDALNGNYIWTGIDTIYRDTITVYLDTASDPGQKTESYRIGALDMGAIGNFSGAFGIPHSTMHARAVFNPCQGSIRLEWSAYRGWADSLQGYRVYLKREPDPFSLYTPGTLSDTFLTVAGIGANRDYCLYVQAEHSDGRSSRSNTVCLFSAMPRQPDYINTDFVTRTGKDLDLKFTIDPLAETRRYDILRRTAGSVAYDTIHRISGHTGISLSYTDREAGAGRWVYQLAARNDCGRIVARSVPAGNMELESYSSRLNNMLSWNTYRTWLGGVESYSVYRAEGTGQPRLIASLSADDSVYTDDVSAYQHARMEGEFCYHILAVEGAGNPYGIQGSSRSNVSCISVEPVVYLPNAIVPNSSIPENRLFLPVFSFAPAEYRLIIYNRWNNKVFETSDYLQPWDGNADSQGTATEASYVYFIWYRTAGGKEHTLNGHVTVLYR